MPPLDPRPGHEPRLVGVARTLQEEEEFELALTILRINQRLLHGRRGGSRRPL